MSELRVRPLVRDDLVDFLPLFAGYQRFYGARSDRTRNLRFFGRFIAPSEAGVVLGAWWQERPVGFACVYWTYSSVRATRVALLNDLYVTEDARGQGVGRKLLSSAKTARRLGAASASCAGSRSQTTRPRVACTTAPAQARVIGSNTRSNSGPLCTRPISL